VLPVFGLSSLALQADQIAATATTPTKPMIVFAVRFILFSPLVMSRMGSRSPTHV
jgi:hypothetical protein